MKKSLSVLTILFVIVFKSVFAGDTIRVMHYNLLYYDKYIYNCNTTNNNVDNKDEYLRTITSHYKPDIFTVNEMNGHVTSVNRLLNNVFNINGRSNYKRGAYTGSFIVNMLYYNSNKLELKWQGHIETPYRLTDVYRLFYKSHELVNGDTTFVTCIVTHLKAGNSPEDASDRALAASQIMSYINNRNIKGNIMLMGDFNMYTSNEVGFQTFMTPTSTGVRFYDPVNALGSWQDNPAFARYHTQSTRTSGDCHSGGGMDDRFDFILSTNPILEGSMGATYIEDTYWAFGQDGNRLNKTLISPTNTTLPGEVITALYNNSDHLPVVLKLYVDATPLISSIIGQSVQSKFRLQNPFSDNIRIWTNFQNPENARVRVFNIVGGLILDKTMNILPGDEINLNSQSLKSGVYLVEISGNGFRDVAKIIKN
jgi:endonuclease/exonuclease/phosphatase family metal-dependent hydrolase